MEGGHPPPSGTLDGPQGPRTLRARAYGGTERLRPYALGIGRAARSGPVKGGAQARGTHERSKEPPRRSGGAAAAGRGGAPVKRAQAQGRRGRARQGGPRGQGGPGKTARGAQCGPAAPDRGAGRAMEDPRDGAAPRAAARGAGPRAAERRHTREPRAVAPGPRLETSRAARGWFFSQKPRFCARRRPERAERSAARGDLRSRCAQKLAFAKPRRRGPRPGTGTRVGRAARRTTRDS